MTDAAPIEGALYLLTRLQFPVGGAKPVTLYGGVSVGGGELRFVLSDKLNAALPRLNPGDATPSIPAPFGMTGVTLDGFDADGRIYKDSTGSTSVDLVLHANASLGDPPLLTLDGKLVFEKGSARLVIVTLTAARSLTLTDFVTSVLGGSWDWMDDLTRQIAFRDGSMYYLSSTTAWQYPATTGPTYKTGYHVTAGLRLFEQYDFDIALDVDDKAITLAGSVDKLDFDFVTFQKPQLKICTKSTGGYFQISTDILLLGTQFSVDAAYLVDQHAFGAKVSKSFDVDIPGIGSSSGAHVDLLVRFVWTSGTHGGFRITEFTGLPQNMLDLAAQVQAYLNQIKISGGCEQILGDVFKDLCKTTLTPGLDGTPTKENGQMVLPLKLTYTLSLAGRSMSPQVIGFKARFNIPTSLSGVPGAMWASAVDSRNLPGIVSDILSNAETYKALAIAVGVKVGASAGAKMLCRALQNFGKDVAGDIAKSAGEFVAADVGAAAELAAAIASISVVTVVGIVNAFLDFLSKIWDEITEPITHAKQKREDADNAAIDAQAARIRAAIKPVWDTVAVLEGSQPVASLKVGIDRDDQFSAVWTKADLPAQAAGATVRYQLQLLSGSPGEKNSIWPGTQPQDYSADQASASIPLARIPNPAQFGLNAVIQCFITGIAFLTPKTDSDLTTAIGQLSGSELSSAKTLAAQLTDDLKRLRTYNTNGVQTAPVYGVLDMPAFMTVGKSRIGRNTRIRRS